MGVADDFRTFLSSLTVSRRTSIASRCGLITRRLNLSYWDTESKTNHSFYTGSFGRNTAVDRTSDVDMIFRLPYEQYRRFNAYSGNGQAALLEEVRQSIKKTYSVTRIGRDGCVVVVPFEDGIRFEVQPAFLNKDGSYTFPDSSDGGSWHQTDPKAEIQAISDRDAACNSNLRRLCRMARAWKDQWNVPISGLLIDTLAYRFIDTWEHRDKSFLYYDFMSRDFFDYLAGQDSEQDYWMAPGSSQYVWRTGGFEYKAKRCRNISIEAINHATSNHAWSSRQKWREVYGTGYPA